MTFKSGNTAIQRIRSLCVPSVVFAGAGAGDAGMCTSAAITALKRCHVCLYDSLVDPELLSHMPDTAQKIYVGKRRGEHSLPQEDISTLICDHARKGRRVVRLKGGDPGVFGRLGEETCLLESHSIAFRVIPGISSLLSATTSTGMLLTRRGTSNGFTGMSSRQQGGGTADVTSAARSQLPIVLFMSVSVTREVTDQLIADGTLPDTPAAIVFNAGYNNEHILRGTVSDIADKIDENMLKSPGLLIIGSVAAHEFKRTDGALQNKRILLTCSHALQEKAAQLVYDFGGIPIQFPLINLVPSEEGSDAIQNLQNYDWLILSSPSSVRCFAELIKKVKIDIRSVPKLLVCGPGTAAELNKIGLHPDAMPETDYSTAGILTCAESAIEKGMKVLRLRSQKAGTTLSTKLRNLDFQVDDCIIYHNEQINYEELPEFDTQFCASGSAVDSFVTQWGTDPLKKTTTIVLGTATQKALQKHGIEPNILSPKPTVEAAIYALACYNVNQTPTGLSRG